MSPGSVLWNHKLCYREELDEMELGHVFRGYLRCRLRYISERLSEASWAESLCYVHRILLNPTPAITMRLMHFPDRQASKL